MAVVLGVRGGLSVDHLVTAGAGARFGQLGGPGLYGALGGRMVEGVRVRLATNLPREDLRFVEVFERLGIDTAASTTTPTVPRVWILNAPEGRRIVETAPRASAGAEIEQREAAPMPPSRDLEEADLPAEPAFYAGLDALLESSPLARPPANPGTVVGIDPHQLPLAREGLAHLRRVSPPGAVLLPSRVQLGLLGRVPGVDPRCTARRLADELGTWVFARLDSDGLFVTGPDGSWSVRDPAVRVTETTGAGDSSAAAILGALALGADPVTAAGFGVSAARLALSDWGHLGLARAAPLSAPLDGIISTPERTV
jgi:sugar/nucleoside kinase (ribokinase family)